MYQVEMLAGGGVKTGRLFFLLLFACLSKIVQRSCTPQKLSMQWAGRWTCRALGVHGQGAFLLPEAAPLHGCTGLLQRFESKWCLRPHLQELQVL